MSLRPQACKRVQSWHRVGVIAVLVLVALLVAHGGTGNLIAGADDGPTAVRIPDDPQWAFKPMRPVDPPAVRNEAWCRTPIDRFIMAKLEAKGMLPNGPAERRKLIRRAYFDLIGLPPEPEDVERFLNDRDPTAYEKLIERILQSPQYGERWGRHWLDLARFAESHGYEQDYDRPNAYHYRDFVIKALNQDMPYDQFVKWQIAGDEFAPSDPLALMATGFLAAGTHATQITANQAEKERYDELDDMIRTIGATMLGLTIGCARCHDHKFDPIPTADYYRLISTFSTTVRSDHDVDLDPDGYRAAKATYDAEHAPLVADLVRFEREELPDRFNSYRKTHTRLSPESPWILPDLSQSKSAGGATITRLDDGSSLVSGTNPDNDSYTFVLTTQQTGIRAIRIEALSDKSLPHGGPGRASNGNFGLSDLRVVATPIATQAVACTGSSDGDAKAAVESVQVKLVKPRSTFAQNGLPVMNAVDDSKDSCWAVDPQFGKDHAAIFDFETPIGYESGTSLEITLRFNCNKQHGIGRARFALTTREDPPIEGTPVPEVASRVLAALDADPSVSLTAEQTSALLTWFRPHDPQWQRLRTRVKDHEANAPKQKLAKVLVSSEGVPAVRLHTQGLDFYDPTHHLKRGDPNQKGEVASQGFLNVLVRSADLEKRWQEAPPAEWRTSYRRRALSNWLVDVDQGAGQLLARVIVNRVWYYHMGRGIVTTPSDFGKQGERPSHPELLDWLATEFIKGGWRLKHLHQLIMTSAVYMQTNATDDARLAADRDNVLFWHWNGRRLEAEVIRDSMLATAGQLDRTMFGPGTLDQKHRRRSIYFFVKRSQLVPMMTLFDGPDTLQDLPCRVSTTIAPQALMLMNNTVVRENAAGLLARIRSAGADRDTVIRNAFLHALSRYPGEDERAAADAFLSSQSIAYEQDGQANASELAWIDFCQALLCLNEYVYID